MKILCIIDSLGAGGAQRQMVNLVCGLRAKGHEVELFIYFPKLDFFKQEVDLANIRIHEFTNGRGFSFKLLWYLMRLIKQNNYDVVISYMPKPNIYAEISCAFFRSIRLVVSERTSHHGDNNKYTALVKRLLHGFADVVVVNSYSQASWLYRYAWLEKKIKTIYNGYRFDRIQADRDVCFRQKKLLVVGRISPEKNGLRLIQALIMFQHKYGYAPSVSWAGKLDNRSGSLNYYNEIKELLEQYPSVKENWSWLGERQDIPVLLKQHFALIHPSLYEGLPNVICEAFIASRPVLASNVCDHPLLVENEVRGFLFNPYDPESIVKAIEALFALTNNQWKQLSNNARAYADEYLSIDRMISEYETLFHNA